MRFFAVAAAVAFASTSASAARDGPSLSCGGLCFSGNFNDNGILQRAPQRSSLYGATPAGSVGAVTVNFASTDGSFAKNYSAAILADFTWKVTLDAMPTGGNYTATLSCDACAGSPAPQQRTYPRLNPAHRPEPTRQLTLAPNLASTTAHSLQPELRRRVLLHGPEQQLASPLVHF